MSASVATRSGWISPTYPAGHYSRPIRACLLPNFGVHIIYVIARESDVRFDGGQGLLVKGKTNLQSYDEAAPVVKTHHTFRPLTWAYGGAVGK